MLAFYFSYIPNSLKEVSLNDDEIIEYNSDEEVDLGDENCVRYAQKCSYTCSGYQYKGSRPSNCRSGVPSNGGCAGSSFYVSCSNTGGVYCYRTSQRNTCIECKDNYELKLIIHSLNELRNSLITQNKDYEIVDEVLIKYINVLNKK